MNVAQVLASGRETVSSAARGLPAAAQVALQSHSFKRVLDRLPKEFRAA